jgi:hypothetical protein
MSTKVDPAGLDAEERQAGVEVAEGRDDAVELPRREAFDEADDVLQREGDADRRDEGDELGTVAQGTVGHFLHEHRDAAGGGHADTTSARPRYM